jgi:hypothetical protein
MTPSLPHKFALVGIVIGITTGLSLWFVLTFNIFHLPDVNQVTQSFKEPRMLSIIEYSNFVLCPGTLLQIFTIGIGGWIGWVIWILTGPLLNAPIYYAIGVVVDTMVKQKHSRGAMRK